MRMNHITCPRNLLVASSQGLKLGLDYLDHPCAQDIKKTGRVSVESLSSSVL
jgi:hypothetical protein